MIIMVNKYKFILKLNNKNMRHIIHKKIEWKRQLIDQKYLKEFKMLIGLPLQQVNNVLKLVLNLQ